MLQMLQGVDRDDGLQDQVTDGGVHAQAQVGQVQAHGDDAYQ